MSDIAEPRLHILEIETFGRGGLAHYAFNLSCALAERGHEVSLMTAAGYELDEKPLPANVHLRKSIARFTHRMGDSVLPGVKILLRKFEAVVDAFRVAGAARRLAPDVIHLHCTNQIALLYIVLFRMLGTSLSVTAHVVTPHEPLRLQNTIYRRIHRLPHLVIAHSEFDRKRLLAEFDVASERVAVIPHGEYGFFESDGVRYERIPCRRDLGLGPDDEVVLFFGYIREYKGLDVLFEAWSEVAKARPAARLVVAGDPVQLSPERREEFIAWATKLGVIHRFDYIPFSDVGRYFAATDVLVMPYRHISQSGVLYLALSLKVPVVASAVGALPEMLSSGDNALLVPPESPRTLAQALIQVLGDPTLRSRLARGGREVAERHSWPHIAKRTEAAFTEILSR